MTLDKQVSFFAVQFRNNFKSKELCIYKLNKIKKGNFKTTIYNENNGFNNLEMLIVVKNSACFYNTLI